MAAREALIDHLVALCDRDPESAARLKKYSSHSTGRQAVEGYVDVVTNGQTRLTPILSTVEKLRTAEGQKGFLTPNYRSSISRDDKGGYYSSTELDNPDYVIEAADLAEKYFKAVQEASKDQLKFQEELLKVDTGANVAVKAPFKVYIHEKTDEFIRLEGFNRGLEAIRWRVGQLEARGDRVKKGLPLVVDAQWTQAELREFNSQNKMYELLQRAESREKVRELLVQLSDVWAKLLDRKEEKVAVRKGGSYTKSRVEAVEIEALVAAVQTRVSLLERQINAQDVAIRAKQNEDKGIFGRKEKKIAEDVATLNTKRSEMVEEMEERKAEIQRISKGRSNVARLSEIVEATNFATQDQEMTIAELHNQLKKHLEQRRDEQFPPEEQQVYDTYRRLEKKAASAKAALEKATVKDR